MSDVETPDLNITLEEDVQLTSAELIEIMEQMWINEKFAPEILPHQQDIVDSVLEQLTYMEKNLAGLSSQDFKKPLHQLEIDRIRFVVSSYLRRRLKKIETYVLDILKQEAVRVAKEDRPYLTPAEARFAESYKQALGNHFLRAVDSNPGLPMDDWLKQPVVPNLHSFVFCEAKQNIEGIVIEGGDDVVDANPGSRMIIAYKSIANLVVNDQVQLI